jgi:hypothetical protein
MIGNISFPCSGIGHANAVGDIPVGPVRPPEMPAALGDMYSGLVTGEIPVGPLRPRVGL